MTPLFIQGAYWDDSKAKLRWWAPAEERIQEDGTTKMVGGMGLFAHWGPATAAQLGFFMAQAWLGTLLVKRLSSVAKSLSKSVSTVLMVFARELFLKACYAKSLKPNAYYIASSVMLASILFSQLEREDSQSPLQRSRPGGREVELQSHGVENHGGN